MRLRAWLLPSRRRERLLQGLGLLALGVVLARRGVVAPASACPRRSWLEGGDEPPGFCADFGDPLGWPFLALGLGLLALGVVLLWRAAGETPVPTLLRGALLAAVAGSALLYAAWSLGSGVERAVAPDGPTDSGGGASCREVRAPWAAWAVGGGGFLLGVGASLLAGALAAARPRGAGRRGDVRPVREG